MIFQHQKKMKAKLKKRKEDFIQKMKIWKIVKKKKKIKMKKKMKMIKK